MSIKLGNTPYKERIEKGLNNDFMRQAVASAQGRFRSGKQKAFDELGSWEEWRSLGEEIRSHTLENLDFYIEQLSEQVEKRGGKVYFVQTHEETKDYIRNIVIR